MEARTDRRPSGFAKRGFAFVGGVVQHIPDGLVIPVRFARARPDACLMETATHRVDRAAFLADPRKHLLHHACFVPHDSKTRISATFLFGHIPVAVRGMAQDTDMPRLRGVPLAPSAPFKKFGPLLFCNHALHLQPDSYHKVMRASMKKQKAQSF